jgi:hypothetical protein
VFKAACAGYCVAVDAAAHTTVLLLTSESPGCTLQQTFWTYVISSVCVWDHGALELLHFDNVYSRLKSIVAASILESFIPKAKFDWFPGFVVLRGPETLMTLGRWGDDAGLRMGRVSHCSLFGRTWASCPAFLLYKTDYISQFRNFLENFLGMFECTCALIWSKLPEIHRKTCAPPPNHPWSVSWRSWVISSDAHVAASCRWICTVCNIARMNSYTDMMMIRSLTAYYDLVDLRISF